MEILITIIIIVNLIVLLFIFYLLSQKFKTNGEKTEQTEVLNKLSDLQLQLDNKLNNQISQLLSSEEKTYNRVENKMSNQNQQLSVALNQVIERIAKIDTSQGQILGLSESIENLEKVLTDKKTRGIYGEIQLKAIFSQIFGEKNDIAYSEQYKLSNNTIVDFAIRPVEPLELICIDSKFPLENYLRMQDEDNDLLTREKATKEFKQNVKKHINDISNKYIIEGETANQALMFIPSEGVFSEINSNHSDLIDYSFQKKVVLVSPTTIVAILNTLQMLVKEYKRTQHAKEIQSELKSLAIEFERFARRYEAIEKTAQKQNKELVDFKITIDKINTRFERINEADFE